MGVEWTCCLWRSSYIRHYCTGWEGKSARVVHAESHFTLGPAGRSASATTRNARDNLVSAKRKRLFVARKLEWFSTASSTCPCIRIWSKCSFSWQRSLPALRSLAVASATEGARARPPALSASVSARRRTRARRPSERSSTRRRRAPRVKGGGGERGRI